MTVVLMAVLFARACLRSTSGSVHVVLMARGKPATVDIEVARGDRGSVAPEAGERANGIGGERWHDTSGRGWASRIGVAGVSDVTGVALPAAGSSDEPSVGRAATLPPTARPSHRRSGTRHGVSRRGDRDAPGRVEIVTAELSVRVVEHDRQRVGERMLAPGRAARPGGDDRSRSTRRRRLSRPQRVALGCPLLDCTPRERGIERNTRLDERLLGFVVANRTPRKLGLGVGQSPQADLARSWRCSAAMASSRGSGRRCSGSGSTFAAQRRPAATPRRLRTRAMTSGAAATAGSEGRGSGMASEATPAVVSARSASISTGPCDLRVVAPRSGRSRPIDERNGKSLCEVEPEATRDDSPRRRGPRQSLARRHRRAAAAARQSHRARRRQAASSAARSCWSRRAGCGASRLRHLGPGLEDWRSAAFTASRR